MDGWKDGQAYIPMDGWMDHGWLAERAGGQMIGWAGGCMDEIMFYVLINSISIISREW